MLRTASEASRLAGRLLLLQRWRGELESILEKDDRVEMSVVVRVDGQRVDMGRVLDDRTRRLVLGAMVASCKSQIADAESAMATHNLTP